MIAAERFDLSQPGLLGSEGQRLDRFDPRALPIYDLYRRLRHLVLSPERLGGPEALSTHLLQALVETPDTPSMISGGRVYCRSENGFALIAKVGEAGPVALGYQVPLGYAVVQQLLASGWVLMRRSDPRFDPAIEGPIGAETFAAITLGPARDYLISFTLREPVVDSELVYALSTLRSIADLILRQRELTAFLDGAKEIQTSLLPTTAPRLEGFSLAFRSRPAEIVGGDVYDFLPRGPGMLGLCIADATGHGLPAALQARDVVTGLRMGVAQELGLVQLVETLARVVDASRTSGRFISLVYAELDYTGGLAWVNAGHVSPVIVRADGGVTVLGSTGPVMGLGMRVGYSRELQRLAPGDVLLLYTDGLTEARSASGEELGLERLAQAVRQMPGARPEVLVEGIFRTVDRFTQTTLQEDDQTLVAVRRTAR